MDYIFILGSHPTWSVAEIASVLGESDLFWENERILLKKNIEIVAENLIKRLGGTLKIAQVEFCFSYNLSFSQLTQQCTQLLLKKANRSEGKLVFGLSDYGISNYFDLNKIGLNIKKELKKNNISSRLVTSKEKELSTVVVGQNKLLKKGAELIFFLSGKKIFVARTLAIQPYKDLSRRDFGRPCRDDYSGMLPPKLAQIMINCASPRNFSDILLDPFCGSGTIITEAMIMGYRQLIGTDLSEKAIKDSRANAEWIREIYNLDIYPKFYLKNAIHLAKFLKPKTVGTIVSEPYLGPQRDLNNIKEVKIELENLYFQALDNFYQILSPEGRVVMVWPVFFGQEYLSLVLNKWKLVEILPRKFYHLPWAKLSPRKTLIYHRPSQKVWRELIILEK